MQLVFTNYVPKFSPDLILVGEMGWIPMPIEIKEDYRRWSR